MKFLTIGTKNFGYPGTKENFIGNDIEFWLFRIELFFGYLGIRLSNSPTCNCCKLYKA